MARILNFGSLNIDFVYKVPHFVQPGETLTSGSLQLFAGGKGANQSAALAKAGAAVLHAGKVGSDGVWLKKKLKGLGCTVTAISVDAKEKSGHAIIQIDPSGENAIVLYSGTNRQITVAEIESAFKKMHKGDLLLLQNEISSLPNLIKKGHKMGLHICLNPAPMDGSISKLPLHLVSTLIINETEAAGMLNQGKIVHTISSYKECAKKLKKKFNIKELIVTLGNLGVLYEGEVSFYEKARKVKVVDTTAAGDTFIGYFLAGKAAGIVPRLAVQRAMLAAELCIGKEGAMDSIPSAAQVDKLYKLRKN